MEQLITNLSGLHDPRLQENGGIRTHVFVQDAEISNLHSNSQHRREHSPVHPAPPPASPIYTGLNEDEEDQWVRTHPGWAEGHPLMWNNQVRSISFGPWSYLKRPIDILCCLPKEARRCPIREPWSAAGQGAIKSKIVTMETLAYQFLTSNLLELLASDELLNAAEQKIGGTLPWRNLSNLVFVETNEKDCANKELKLLITDERSAVSVLSAMIFSAESLGELIVLGINLRNQLVAGEALQMLMLCICQAIKFTAYKRRIELIKAGPNCVKTSSGIRPLLVINEIIFSPAENRCAKLINDSCSRTYALHPFSMLYSRHEANIIEIRTVTSAISELALDEEYNFEGMCHVTIDGLLVANTDTLEPVNGATNILYGLGNVLVIPVKPGYIDQQPRRKQLTLMLFNCYDTTVCCFVPKMEKHQFKPEYKDRTTELPGMLATYSRRLLMRLPMFVQEQLGLEVKPLDSLYNWRDLLETKKSRKRTWSQQVFTKKSD